MSKEQIFRQLYDNQVKRDAYIDSVPSDLSAFVYDNEYVNSLDADRSVLMDEVFGEHVEAIYWFLYEWKPGAEVGFDGHTEAIQDIDQYISWMKRFEGFV